MGSGKLRDGTTYHIRPIRPEDADLLMDGFKRLSPETIRQRFFAPMRELPRNTARQLAEVDHITRSAVVAEIETGGGLLAVGVARYEPSDQPGVVELAATVCDEWQNRGIGRLLVREIVRRASANGFRVYKAEVLADNHRMIHLLSSELNILKSTVSAGVMTLLMIRRVQAAA